MRKLPNVNGYFALQNVNYGDNQSQRRGNFLIIFPTFVQGLMEGVKESELNCGGMIALLGSFILLILFGKGI